jgi:seryl-tRNA synthetase
MTQKTDLRRLDNQLSSLEWRLGHLRGEREKLEAALRRKRKPDTRAPILERIEAIDSQINAALKEEWDADSDRYNLIWSRR